MPVLSRVTRVELPEAVLAGSIAASGAKGMEDAGAGTVMRLS